MPIELSVLTEKLREQGKTEDEIQSITKYYDDYVQQEDLKTKQLEQQQADEEAANRSVVGSAASKLARGWVSAAKGATALKNNIIFGAINAFNPDLSVEEKKGISNVLKNETRINNGDESSKWFSKLSETEKMKMAIEFGKFDETIKMMKKGVEKQCTIQRAHVNIPKVSDLIIKFPLVFVALPKVVPPSLKKISPPSASRTISAMASIVKLPEDDIL